MISLRNIEKVYEQGVNKTYVLRRVDVDVREGEFVSIMGPSGAGKSTLLNILGMFDSAWTGEYHFWDTAVHRLGKKSAPNCTNATSASSSKAITCSTI
jgi:ABC-type lipoprotein export system ATPase subunit